MIKWTVAIVPSAMAEHDKIPRGPAGDVTDAITALGKNQKLQGCQEVVDRPNTYKILVKGYTIEYELVKEKRLVRILAIS